MSAPAPLRHQLLPPLMVLILLPLFFSLYVGVSADSNVPFNLNEEVIVNYFEKEHIVESAEEIANDIGPLSDFTDEELAVHHNYDNMTAYLKRLHAAYPDLTTLNSIGRSVENRELWVLVISKDPKEHVPGKPEFKYVANMHGNEVVSREVILFLAELLLKNYGSNAYITKLVDTTRIHLMPSMNPDGYERAREGDEMMGPGRDNANGIDLNRNFPRRKGSSQIPEIETRRIMEWALSVPFVLSANLHGGTSIVNYPFDDSQFGKSKTGDHDVFVKLAYSYARAHPSMWKKGLRCTEEFSDPPKGITNGAEWYEVSGGMQDWMYLYANCFEITVETNCHKFPYAKDMPVFWKEHKYALLRYIELTHHTIHGFIFDEQTGLGIQNATISINSRGRILKSYKYGDYWRPVTPGSYEVTFDHMHYYPVTKVVNITTESPSFELNVTLTPHSYTPRRPGDLADVNEPGLLSSAPKSRSNLMVALTSILFFYYL
uniref:Peptidase_M14 domain-containing protein n=1 Tax=Panagrellus redivivus TaxID=6233 RepID=A0A7E4VVU3_PANRE